MQLGAAPDEPCPHEAIRVARRGLRPRARGRRWLWKLAASLGFDGGLPDATSPELDSGASDTGTFFPIDGGLGFGDGGFDSGDSGNSMHVTGLYFEPGDGQRLPWATRRWSFRSR